ncbi:MAG: HAD-IA family hydrolase [Agarilytica sp.]
MEIRHIIWDFDGTLFDTYSAIAEAFQKTLSHDFGIRKSVSDIYALCKIDTKHCTAVLAQEYDIDERTILHSVRSNYDQMSDAAQEPFPYVRDICETINKNGGKNFIITHRDRHSLMKHIEQHNFEGIFTEIITRDDPFPEKPSPESFSYLIQKHQLNQDSTIGVGDRDIDILAANAAGIGSVFFCADAITSSHSDLNISHFKQLLASLNGTKD